MDEVTHGLNRLAAADPDLAREVGAIVKAHGPVSADRMTLLVEETLWGLSQEKAFGAALAKGYARLVGGFSDSKIEFFRQRVRAYGRQGATVGRVMAQHLLPVLVHGSHDLAPTFCDVFDTMCRMGTYTLKGPFKALSALLRSGDVAAGTAYLNLLQSAFSQDISYNQSLRFVYTLPTAVSGFVPFKRAWQIAELTRIVRADPLLAEAYLEGKERGLDLLSRDSLHRFIDAAMEKFKQAPEQGVKFMALDSGMALDLCRDLQVAVPLVQVQQSLMRYVRARTGKSVAIRPANSVRGDFGGLAGEAPPGVSPESHMVFSDTRAIYLPDEIGCFPNQTENRALYMALAKLEAGLLEFGTHDFDFEKAIELCRGADLCAGLECIPSLEGGRAVPENGSDLERFFNLFPDDTMAAGLFTIFEHGRVRLLLARHYPGLVKRVLPLFRAESRRMQQAGEGDQLLLCLYHTIALGAPDLLPLENQRHVAVLSGIQDGFDKIMVGCGAAHRSTESVFVPETSALLTMTAYSMLARTLHPYQAEKETQHQTRSTPLFPFGRHLRPDLVFNSFAELDALSRNIISVLREKGVKAYKSDVRQKLVDNKGCLSPEDLEEIALKPGVDGDRPDDDLPGVDLSDIDLAGLLQESGVEVLTCEDGREDACRHPEWDCNVGDYLKDYVRVMDNRIQGCEGDFYSQTLKRHAGLVKQMRHAFELLRPEGLAILRQWIEGDQFDYRALLDFALDRKAGIMPSDRLYIKRIKQQRDVAVLVLVDLSRSTANQAAGSHETVLDVEKAAIVLLCEALGVVGDKFALAGFSGTGRFGVDYFRIKDFDEPVGPETYANINGMVARRSTRMGAAIRHATQQLEQVSARVRLLMVIGDGFPNDVGYKKAYAIADTRKAILEAMSRNIVFKGISVNMAGDPKLDALYGNFNHNVISDIAELPDKLLRIYGAMTKI
jgi:nitric oxide reductase NorD protein